MRQVRFQGKPYNVNKDLWARSNFQWLVSRCTVLLTLLTLTVGCAGPKVIPEASYEYSLSAVDLRDKEDWDQYTVAVEDTSENQVLTYQDGRIKAGFAIGPQAIEARFLNPTSNIQRVQLQNGLFIGADETAQELVTGDMSYANRNVSPRPIILRSKQSKATTLIPRQHIEFSKTQGVVIMENLMSPTLTASMNMAEKAKERAGDTIQVVLPVQTRGEVRQYRFKFSVSDVLLPPDRAIQALLDGEVSKGLRTEYVRKIKGDPKETRKRDGRTIWYYGTVTDRTKIIFENGKVTEVK